MLKVNGNKFELDGKEFHIYSGAMHYFRTVPEYWEDRLKKLKAAGFNTVETYVCWNLHEPQPNQFNFDGILDIEKYLEIAQKVGLYAIVRPGPYICAEWDFGGLPSWLLKDKNMQIRCMYPDFLDCISRFYKELLSRLVPHLQSNGGNIIAMQVENEYGSYGNDKEYLRFVEKLTRDCGIDCMLFTSDGNENNMISGGSLPDVFKVLNFGSHSRTAFEVMKNFENVGPKMCGEFWCGWFDHWRDIHHTRNSLEIVDELKGFIENDASFNIYMFHGGTNFGFTAGANHNPNHGYEPTVTSYDYCALLTEWGEYTKAYHAVRELLHKTQGLELGELPPSPQLQSIGKVELTECASLLDNLDNIGTKHHAPVPESMEHFDQNFGMIYYETKAFGTYDMSPLFIKNVHDFANVYIDGELKHTIDRTLYTLDDKTSIKDLIFKNKKGESDPLVMPKFKGEKRIGVLVDTMGRVNYGENMLDRKGISDIYLGIQRLMNYDIWTLPMDNLNKLDFSKKPTKSDEPAFLKGKFKASSKADCFVHLDGFERGFVLINGFNLGRYWEVGPQKSLYIPGAILKDENEIIIFNISGNSANSVEITDKHDIG